MEKIDLNTIVEFYEYFYKKRFGNPKYKYKPSKRAEKIIGSFLTLLDKHYDLKLIGRDFLWSYFIYQLNHWRSAELKAFYGRFRIEMIIGKKAFNRFVEDEYELMWVIEHSEIIDLYEFRRSDLIEESKRKYNDSYEEGIKKKHHNTDKGFYYCIENTTLFNHKHTSCMLCKYKTDCKKVLEEKFPKLYSKRGYGKE